MPKVQNKSFLGGRGGRKPVGATENLIKGAYDKTRTKEAAPMTGRTGNGNRKRK